MSRRKAERCAALTVLAAVPPVILRRVRDTALQDRAQGHRVDTATVPVRVPLSIIEAAIRAAELEAVEA